jgi:hypothetical protein
MLLSEKLETEAQKKENKKQLEELEQIYKETDSKLNTSLCSTEFILARNIDQGLQRKVRLNGKEYNTFTLYYYLEKALARMIEIAVKLAIKYSLDLPFDNDTTGIQGNTMDFNKI